jgi:hypothetical protein
MHAVARERRLPDAFRPDVTGDPAASEARGRELMAAAADAIVAGVVEGGERWVVDAVIRLVDAWGRLDAGERAAVVREAQLAGAHGAQRVATELRRLLALDPAEQRSTPLEVVRTLGADATAVLARAGIPPVERDEFEERIFPEDVYGIVLRSLSELEPGPGGTRETGDPHGRDAGSSLGVAQLAWGIGKATLLAARRARGGQAVACSSDEGAAK